MRHSHRKTTPKKRLTLIVTFANKIVDILDFYDKKGDISIQIIKDYINTYNLQIKSKTEQIKCTRTMLDKCLASGCFLFLEKKI